MTAARIEECDLLAHYGDINRAYWFWVKAADRASKQVDVIHLLAAPRRTAPRRPPKMIVGRTSKHTTGRTNWSFAIFRIKIDLGNASVRKSF